MDGEHIDLKTGEVTAPDRKVRHWDVLCRTDPQHTKPFTRSGGFKGTAIRPIWNQYRLTEHFGPAGIGWGFERPEYEAVKGEEELLVFCTLKCWYMDDGGERAELYGVGGDKVLAKQQRGLVSDDEAFKKALTDAIGNAFLRVGLSADVHMGLFEDSKYVAETRRHFAHDVAVSQDGDAPTVATGARQTQGSSSGATAAHGRPQAAPAPSGDENEAVRQQHALARDIDAAVTVRALDDIAMFDAEGKVASCGEAWHNLETLIHEIRPPEVAYRFMSRLVDRIEKRHAMLMGDNVEGYNG